MTRKLPLEVWFVTGSQRLYGDKTLNEVLANAQRIASHLDKDAGIPVRIVLKPVMTTADEITSLCRDASNSAVCIGMIFWMHTFSPAKMWIGGLKALTVPFLHLHTQANRALPWDSIDMDFMNLNQSAHGDREFGYITARLRLPRKVVVGFWQDEDVISEIAAWSRAALGWHESQNLKIVRFGDNMREVAVTEGDKVAAQEKLGFSVNTFGVGDLVARMDAFTPAEVDSMVQVYRELYTLAPEHDRPEALREAARIELGLRAFLVEGGFGAFTDTFQDLHGLGQLPGIAVQRLMADGFGFAGEGDWKTAALVRIMKVMAAGLKGGTSFMEDYTYDFTEPAKVLGSHMLEVCPSISEARPSVQVHPLGIGGKADPVRLVFTASRGPAIVASLIDLGDRFRLIANEVDVIAPEHDLPKLPVARAIWIPRPNLKVAATAWIYAGGAHHTSFSQALDMSHLIDFAEMSGVELIRIDRDTQIDRFRRELHL